jgi:hypothetical protein
VATVVVARWAVDDLATLIRTHSLPADTRERVRRSIEPLAQVPLLGPPLSGRWDGMRFILGPWRWMLVVYRYDPRAGLVTVLAVVDARSSRAPRSETRLATPDESAAERRSNRRQARREQ